MSESNYIFKFTEDGTERPRLQLLEKIHDPATLKLFDQVGDLTGKRCLEVGAGAGSIVRALAERVGEKGEVWALDLDTRFLKGFSEPNIRILQGDIRDVSLPKGSFDLIHTRYVLSHIQKPEKVVAKFYELLGDGGHMALEEHDHTVSRPLDDTYPDSEGMRRVFKAILKNFENRRVDPAIGLHLPELLKDLPWQKILWTIESHSVRGGSETAQLMGESIAQVREQLVGTGEASDFDVDAYLHFCQDGSQEGILFATGRIIAKK